MTNRQSPFNTVLPAVNHYGRKISSKDSTPSPTSTGSKSPSSNQHTKQGVETENKKFKSNLSSETSSLIVQGQDSIRKKLNRPFGIGEKVVLLKDFPNNNLYKGYLCTVTEVFYKRKENKPDEFEYSCEVEFYSTFPDDDPSRNLQPLNNNNIFPITSETIILSSNDFTRLENQDLEYKIYFSDD